MGGPVCRPYGWKRTGRVGSETQAQERDRTSSNFPKTQAPSGAGRNRTQALLILRAGNPLPSERGDPVNGGSRGTANMDTKCPS